MDYRKHYSLAELHNAIDTLPALSGGIYALSSLHEKPAYNWDLNTNYTKSVTLAKTGYKEHGKTIQNFSVLQKTSKKRKFKKCFDIAGNDVSLDRYLQNIPECMIAHKRTGKEQTKKVNAKVVKILAVINVPHSINAKTITSRGQFIFALCEQLELQHNKAVLLDVAIYNSNYKDTLFITTNIKDTNQRLNADLLAFYLIHPAASRRIGFRLKEHAPIEIRDIFNITADGGYGGFQKELTKEMTKDYDLVFNKVIENKDYKFIDIENYIKQVV